MLPRLVRRALAAAVVAVSLVAPAWSQPLPLADTSAAGLSPLWADAGAPPHTRRLAAQSRAPLTPFVTSSLPEDAAWEGFVTPASRKQSALMIAYQGKLVIENTGVAAAISSPFLSAWDGTHFEALPELAGGPLALGLWNGNLIVATRGVGANYAILRLDGTAWDTLGVANNFIWTLGEYQGHLVAGGRFTSVSGVPALLVAAFDGVSWTEAGSGMSGFEVKNLAVHGTSLVAAGTLAPLKAIAAIPALGAAWQTVGAGFTGSAGDVRSDGTYLYACGALSTSGGVPMGGLARWNGSSWTSLASLGASSDARMTLWNGKIISSVRATSGTGAVGRLSQWDGVSLATIPGDSIAFGIGGVVAHLATWGTKFVVSGSFLTNGSTLVPYVVTFDGSQWGTVSEPWQPGMTGPTIWPVTDIRAWGGKLIVSGQFGLVADQDHWSSHVGVTSWDGTHWSPLGNGLLGQFIWLGDYEGDLIAAGYGVSVRGASISNVARWNGSAWTALGAGAPDFVEAMAQFQSDLYVASSDALADPLRKWNGTTWSVVSGLSGAYVDVLAPAGGQLTVGGDISVAEGSPSPNVVFWDGTNWQAAGAGVNGTVLAATEWLGQPVIGGDFTASGATSLPGVAIWDGAAWQPMGSRSVGVDRLRVIDGELFASGDFKLPDDSVVETIAHWTGSDWHVLGSAGGDLSVRRLQRIPLPGGLGDRAWARQPRSVARAALRGARRATAAGARAHRARREPEPGTRARIVLVHAARARSRPRHRARSRRPARREARRRRARRRSAPHAMGDAGRAGRLHGLAGDERGTCQPAVRGAGALKSHAPACTRHAGTAITSRASAPGRARGCSRPDRGTVR